MQRPAVLLALAALLAGAEASVSVTIQNSCSESIALYDNSATTTMAAGATTTRTLANGYVGMFRNGASDEATLAEFSVDSDGTPWYDLSIIPPDSGSCTSLSACQSQTGKTGFNTALQIAPQSNTDSTNCETVTCLADGCDDAYQYPSDDDNTHTCPSGTSFLVTFCPGGSGSSSSTTSTPTPTPTSTPTPTPTPTPTSTPTPTPTPTPTSGSASDSEEGSNDEVAAEAYSGGFSLTNSTSGSDAASASASSNKNGEDDAGVATAADTDSTATETTGTTATTSDDTTSDSNSGAVEINTQSSGGSSSTFGLVFASGIAVVGVAAGGFIYAVRQKKKALDAEAKSPVGPHTHTSREVSVLMSTPGGSAVL